MCAATDSAGDGDGVVATDDAVAVGDVVDGDVVNDVVDDDGGTKTAVVVVVVVGHR